MEQVDYCSDVIDARSKPMGSIDEDDMADDDVRGSTGVGEQDTVAKAVRSLEKTLLRYRQLLQQSLLKQMKSTESTRSSGNVSSMATRMNGNQTSLAVRDDKVAVYVRVVFLKIGEIDTLKEHFTADAFIQARWREPKLDRDVIGDLTDDVDCGKYWNPKLYVENSLNEPKESVWQTVNHNFMGEAMVYERRRIRGCFLENLELGEFPFDTQDLTLTLTTERSECELDIDEDTAEICSINVQSFVDEQEWKLHSHVETWKPSSMPSKVYQTSKHKHPSFSASCRASRRPGFFIWNIFLVMLFICSLTFSTFSVDLELPQNRLQLAFILLLTTISFKFVVCQTLPQISYLTYLDKYILTSMAILCSVCVWHAVIAVIPFVYGRETARVIDRWGLSVCGSAYFLFHVCFFMYIYLVALHKKWKYDKQDKDHRERIKSIHPDVSTQRTIRFTLGGGSCEENASSSAAPSEEDEVPAPIVDFSNI